MLKPFPCIRATLGIALLASASVPALAESSRLTVISFGGATKAAQEVAFYKPFE